MSKSALWNQIINDHIRNFDLKNFREPGQLNSRLAAWNPMEKSLRWFRSFLLLAANSMTPNQIEIYKKCGDVSLGNPVTVSVLDLELKPVEINLDYLLSAIEVEFISEFVSDEQSVKRILEVGAGFGRTCHALMNNFHHIEKYVIIDLPEMLEISSLLGNVLSSENFKKLQFVNALDEVKVDFSFDLSIQIDGLQEMDVRTIEKYFFEFFSKSRFFLSINPVGKYPPTSAGLENIDEDILKTVMALGRSRKLIDIWKMNDIYNVRKSHILDYCPFSATIRRSCGHPYFPHYEIILYENSKN